MAQLAFFIPDMSGGGAERVALTLIENFISRGHSVDLVVMRARGQFLAMLPGEVRVVDLKVDSIRSVIRPFARYLRTSRPDAVQVSMWPLTVMAVIARALARTKTRLILSDHTTLSRQYAHFGWWRRFVQRMSLRIFYPLADSRVVVSHSAADDLAVLGGLPRNSLEVIYNPIEKAAPAGVRPEIGTKWGQKGARILTVGSLKPAKNHHLLLTAFAMLTRDRDARLMILGDGPLRAELENLARNLEIADRVVMPGFTLDPGPYYAAADLFVLSSDYEGYGNVLVEAMQAGLPVVSTDCESGPREILDGGHYGRLVPVGDAQALTAAMAAALDGPVDPEKLEGRARELGGSDAIEAYARALLNNGKSPTIPEGRPL